MSLPSIFSSALSAGAFFAPARTARRIAFTGLIVASLPALCADYTQSFGIDLYGRSYHHNLPAGERDKLNEANIGFALRSTVYKNKHSFSVDAGAFMNSYYDPAYWVGAEYRYSLFKHFKPGLMLRHWESDTYPEKAVNKYLTITIPLTEDVRTTFIVRSSGYIVFVGLDF